MMARFDNMMQEEPQRVRVPVMVDAINAAAAPIIPKPNEWHHNNRFYRVPPTFCLPQGMTRLNGWWIWLTGLVAVHNNTSWMIKPIRELRGIDMPTKSQERVLTLQWRPIFKYKEGVLGYSIPGKVDEAFVRQSFDDATEAMKSSVSYIWESAKDEKDLATLKLASWSKKVQRSEILKYGTAADKLHLPLETARNKPDKRKRGGWTLTPKAINKVPRAGTKKIGDRSN
jgi:hypothetical protein